MTDWRISDHLAPHNASMLKAYRDMPGFLAEHFGIEQQVLAGGYGYRQVLLTADRLFQEDFNG